MFAGRIIIFHVWILTSFPHYPFHTNSVFHFPISTFLEIALYSMLAAERL